MCIRDRIGADPTPPGAAVPVGLALVLIGFLILISRRQAISQLVGFVVLDNGIATVAFLIVGGVPLVVELGVMLDVLLVVLILRVLTGRLLRAFGATDLDGKSVCIVIPDDTRSCPLAMLVKAVHGALHGRVSRLTALVALGTHKAMTEEALGAMLGFEPGRMEETYPGLRLLNHEWWDPSTFVDLGFHPSPSRPPRGLTHV